MVRYIVLGYQRAHPLEHHKGCPQNAPKCGGCGSSVLPTCGVDSLPGRNDTLY